MKTKTDREGKMRIVKDVEEIVNASLLPPGSRIYASGSAATPQAMFRQLAADESEGSLLLNRSRPRVCRKS